jgi:hypothetical protein
MRRDIKSEQDAVQSLMPLVRTASADGVGADLRDFDGALAIVEAGAIVAAGLQTPKLSESDDSTNGVDGVWNDVVAADLLGAFVALTQNSVQRVGYVGRKRWLRVIITHTSGTSVATSAVVVRGKPHQAAVA